VQQRVDQLGALARAAEAAGVIAGYEALAWGKHVKTYRHAWKLVNAVNHPNLGLVLDSFHTLSLNDTVDGIADIPGERIAFVQIADAPKLAMDVLEWSRHYRCFPGQGDFDLANFTAQVVKTGYSGPLSLEIFNDGFRAAPTTITAADGHRSLLFLEEQTRALLESTQQPVGDLYARLRRPRTSAISFSNSRSTTARARNSSTGSANCAFARPAGIVRKRSRFTSTARLRSC
jgi:4-hydroxyphenylpyruvate dioxygenase